MTGPLLASVDPVTKRLPAATEATYAVALLKGQPNGVAEYDNDGDLVNAAGSKIVPTAGVALTGAQNVAGVKPFTDKPVVPDASFAVAKVTGLQAALDDRATDAELGAVATAAANAVARTNHTGTQLAATISDFSPTAGTLLMNLGWRLSLYYDSITGWPTRTLPVWYTEEVIWDSTKNIGAPAPPSVVTGDRWRESLAP